MALFCASDAHVRMYAALRFSKSVIFGSSWAEFGLATGVAEDAGSTFSHKGRREGEAQPNPKNRSGAEIAPSASLSTRDRVVGVASKGSAPTSLFVDDPSFRPSKDDRLSGSRSNVLADRHLRTIEGLSRPSWQHRFAFSVSAFREPAFVSSVSGKPPRLI